MKDLLISFSGGETSAYMAQRLWNEWRDDYNMAVVFANTGEEHEDTLKFVDKCSKHFDMPVTWVEAKVHHQERRGCTHTVVDYATASRNGEPFEEVIKKYGVPNVAFPHCTRELKVNPINSFEKEIGFNKALRAIGIRADEIDRVTDNPKYIYPLVSMNVTKPQINGFWASMPFRLNIASYQGNCKVCFKKSLRKLMTIAKENPEWFDNMRRWEHKYIEHDGESIFRKEMKVDDIFRLSKQDFEMAKDEKFITWEYIQKDIFGNELDLSNGCVESCEIQ